MRQLTSLILSGLAIIQIIGMGCNPVIDFEEISTTTVTLTTINSNSTIIPIPTKTKAPITLSTLPNPPSNTPNAFITPQPGFAIWEQLSKPGIYTLQYSVDEWIEEEERLRHLTISRCFLTEHRGTDMCMSGGCPDSKRIDLGMIAYSKMSSGIGSAFYTSGSYFSLNFEVHSFDGDEHCIPDAEKVISNIQIRPERGCFDRAAFVTDVTIPDNTPIPAGSIFIKTWRLKNIGTCTWTNQYSLVVQGKSSGTQADWVGFKNDVPPGQTADISIELPAPLFEGIARWEGLLKNEFGDSFGVGSDPFTEMFGKPFWVQITVIPALPTNSPND